MASRLWAWEFLRRHPAHADALDRAAKRFACAGTCGRVRILRSVGAMTAAVPGCLYASSALQDGSTADVLWDPSACPSVLHAVAISVDPSLGMPVFALEEEALAGTLLFTASGIQHLVIRQGLRQLQLSVLGADLRTPVHILPADPGVAADRRGQREAWRALWNLLHTGRLSGCPLRPRRASQRLHQVLMALEGWRAGMPHRDIAITMVGEARVSRDWTDPHGCLRDRVRRAIARGRYLSETGYLRQLKGP